MNLACANKECKAELKYLRGGRLFLMERSLQAIPTLANRTALGTSRSMAASKPVALRRYFWLCESCSEDYVIRSWTEQGVELAPRHPRKPIQNSIHSRQWMMPGLVG